MQLFDEGFYTEDFDQDIFDYIKAKGWPLGGPISNWPEKLDYSHLIYGTYINQFWTETDPDLDADYSKLTKQEFMEKIGMTIKHQGYKLADGSCSSEYKIGDKFVVVDIPSRDKHYRYKAGDIITFTEDDTTENPYFDDEECVSWDRLKAYKPAAPQTAFTKSSLKDGMIVTTRNGNVYTVKGVRLLRDGGGFLCLEDFDDDLTCSAEYGNGNEEFDIISVQQTVTLFKRETEAELKQQRITKELEFAEAKRERLNAHIEKLKKNLQA